MRVVLLAGVGRCYEAERPPVIGQLSEMVERATNMAHRPACDAYLHVELAAVPARASRRPDAALAAATHRLPRVVPAALRRQLRRAVPRLPDADVHALRPRGDPGALHRARPRPAARAHGDAGPDP